MKLTIKNLKEGYLKKRIRKIKCRRLAILEETISVVNFRCFFLFLTIKINLRECYPKKGIGNIKCRTTIY